MTYRIVLTLLALTVTARAADFKGACSKPVSCNAATLTTASDGRTTASFSNGLSFTGVRIDGDGPLFFTDTIVNDGTPVQIAPGSGQGCHFYFTDHGTFTKGWEQRLTIIECDVKLQGARGMVTFTVHRPV
jgi:hypothetical protein